VHNPRYTCDQYALICGLLHQAICVRMEEPSFDEDDLGFTGDVERAFAMAIVDGVLGMESDLRCIDCDMHLPEAYDVLDEVWAAAGLEPDAGWLCLACLAARLGRALVPEDFSDAAFNTPYREAATTR
jgi:hypothetical protein